MCGVNGIFAYHYAANPIDYDELVLTRDHMARRGPDGAGIWASNDSRVGFGHRRLAVIDVSGAASQPMVSADGGLVITFNGEIYNYRELRKGLEARGALFHSNSDTEVLLHLYAEKGADLVHDIRGMFAFAIWNARANSVFLARDPYGIKPLYYADDGWTFRFASQVKALISAGGVSKDPEPAGWAGFYLLGSVPEPFTTYQAVRSLPAGCTMMVDRLGQGDIKRYFSIPDIYCGGEAAQYDEDIEAKVRSAVLDSVRNHLVADVPVGAFLSAGIDSASLVGLMRDAGANAIRTVTVAFEEFRDTADDESETAAEVARRYGTEHVTRMVTRSEFESDLPLILDAMDQPSIDGVNTWFVAKAAQEQGLKVAISGLGGDELFGGYSSFVDIPRCVKTFKASAFIPGAGKLGRLSSSRLIEKLKISPKASGLLEYGGSYDGAYLLKRGLFMPWELQKVLGSELAGRGLNRLRLLNTIKAAIEPMPALPFNRVAALESGLYMRNQLLRDTDWASMAHSLEVRVPLVDATLLRRSAQLSRHFDSGRGKKLLARAPKGALPNAVLERKKTGFTTPIEAWIKHRNPKPEGHKRYLWARHWAKEVAANQPAFVTGSGAFAS